MIIPLALPLLARSCSGLPGNQRARALATLTLLTSDFFPYLTLLHVEIARFTSAGVLMADLVSVALPPNVAAGPQKIAEILSCRHLSRNEKNNDRRMGVTHHALSGSPDFPPPRTGVLPPYDGRSFRIEKTRRESDHPACKKNWSRALLAS